MSYKNFNTPGTLVESAEEFNLLPSGTVLEDRDGWIHTKIADSDREADPARFTTSVVYDDDGRRATTTFYSCWDWDARIVSVPKAKAPRATKAELQAELDRRELQIQALTVERDQTRRERASAQHRAQANIERARRAEADATRLERENSQHAEAAAALVEARLELDAITAEVRKLRALREFVQENLLDEGQLDQCVGFTHGYVAAERA